MAKQLKKGGMGTAALVLGIVGLFIGNFPLGILAIIFGAIGMNRDQRYAKAGFILGIIDTVLAFVVLFIVGSLLLAGLISII